MGAPWIITKNRKVWGPRIWAPELRQILFKSVCYCVCLELGGLKCRMHFPTETMLQEVLRFPG